MKKQAKMMQGQLHQMRETLQNSEFTGSAGNGLVTITIDGEKCVKKISIKPECVDPKDVEGLQDLILAAFESAKSQADQQAGPAMPWHTQTI